MFVFWYFTFWVLRLFVYIHMAMFKWVIILLWSVLLIVMFNHYFPLQSMIMDHIEWSFFFDSTIRLHWFYSLLGSFHNWLLNMIFDRSCFDHSDRFLLPTPLVRKLSWAIFYIMGFALNFLISEIYLYQYVLRHDQIVLQLHDLIMDHWVIIDHSWVHDHLISLNIVCCTFFFLA